MSTWSKKQTKVLITLYEQYTNLYDVTHNDYRNRIKRNQSLQIICEIINNHRPQTTIKDILTKIKTLRTQYNVENQKPKQTKSGMGADEIYEPKLWCYNSLQFLDKHIEKRKSLSNAKNENIDLSQNTECSVDETQSISENNQKKKSRTEKKNNLKEEALSAINLAKQIAEKISTNNNENHSFAKFIEWQLNAIENADILEDLKWEIQVAIRRAKIQDKQQKPSVSSTPTNPLMVSITPPTL